MPEINIILSVLFALCAVIGVLNIFQLVKHKQVLGVSMVPPVVYTLVNGTETVLFAYVNLYGAAATAALMTLTNLIWLVLALYYANRMSWSGSYEPAISSGKDMSDETMFFGRGIATKKLNSP